MRLIFFATIAMVGFHSLASCNHTQSTTGDTQTRPDAVFMGNSITESWVKMDPAFFADHNFVGKGISGQTSAQMLQRFSTDVLVHSPKAVVILAGINDIAENGGPVTLEQILQNITDMALLARDAKIKVILSSVLPANKIPWRTNIQPAEKVIRLNEMIKAYAAKNNMGYVDYYAAMVDKEKGLDKQYSYDGVHPTLAGYKVMEPLVLAAINKSIGKK